MASIHKSFFKEFANYVIEGGIFFVILQFKRSIILGDGDYKKNSHSTCVGL